MPAEISKSSPDRTANTTTEKSRRRSERVVLRIPLQLSAKMPDGKRISIEVHTLVVNAHGGLLDVGMEMPTGQQVILSNSRPERVASGKVVRVEGSEEGRFSVAFEFEFPAPSFWPVSFPPPDWASVESAV
jgi:hypothetical protein